VASNGIIYETFWKQKAWNLQWLKSQPTSIWSSSRHSQLQPHNSSNSISLLRGPRRGHSVGVGEDQEEAEKKQEKYDVKLHPPALVARALSMEDQGIKRGVKRGEGKHGGASKTGKPVTSDEEFLAQKEAKQKQKDNNKVPHQKSLNRLLYANAARTAIRHRKTLQQIDVFKELTSDEISSLIDVMEFQTFEKSEHLVTQGEPGLEFMVIVKGAATVFRDNKEVNRLQSLNWLGEGALVNKNHRRAETVTADIRTAVLVLSYKGYQELLHGGGTAQNTTNEMLSTLSQSRDKDHKRHPHSLVMAGNGTPASLRVQSWRTEELDKSMNDRAEIERNFEETKKNKGSERRKRPQPPPSPVIK
jgi:CRP-like cAMP-binding protein